MPKSAMTLLVVAAVACLNVSCQKIGEPAQFKADLKMTDAQFTDAIPSSYGQLVSVTTGDYPYVAVMWFRKPDETIVAVRINYSRGGIGPQVLEIPRR
jgi:hypothetical protein